MTQLLHAAPREAGGQRTTETDREGGKRDEERNIFEDAMVTISRVSSFARRVHPEKGSSGAGIITRSGRLHTDGFTAFKPC